MAESRQEYENTGNVNPPSDIASRIRTTIVQGSQILMSGLHYLTIALDLLFDGAIVILSGGVPYWYYRLIHPKFSNDIELGHTPSPRNAMDLDPNIKELWNDKLLQVYNVWKTHQIIVSAVLAPTFPLISISPLPKCSWAYIFAILCLVYGSTTFAICIIHEVYFHNIDALNLPTLWYITPDNGFFHRDILRFYVSLSLPTVWFTGFTASSVLTILMILIGVHNSHDHLEIDPSALSTPCHDNSKFLLVVVPLIFVIAAISLVRGIKYAQENFQGNAQ